MTEPGKTLCKVCREPINIDSKWCNACNQYQDGRRFFTLSTLSLALITTLISVVTSFLNACAYVRTNDSSTSVVVTTGDSEYIYLWVANSGRAPSILRGFRLRFDGVAIGEVALELSADDVRKGANYVPQGAKQIRVDARAFSTTIPRARLADELAAARATVEVDVKESTDPGRDHFGVFRRHHTITDTFDAALIREFVETKVPVQ